MLTKCKQTIEKFNNNKQTSDSNNQDIVNELVSSGGDILSNWLDKLHGKSVTDNSIFIELPRFYENEFHRDMAALNVMSHVKLVLIAFF